MKETQEAVILVGHGGVPSDCPSDLVSELKRLEAQRRARGLAEMSPREAEVDRQVRQWPRTDETDPYQAGLRSLATRLERRVSPRRLVTAYNEFCAPSVEDAIDSLVAEGTRRITLVTTMFTPGGSHSERELPEIVEIAQRKYPTVEIRYAWPFDLESAAAFLADQVARG